MLKTHWLKRGFLIVPTIIIFQSVVYNKWYLSYNFRLIFLSCMYTLFHYQTQKYFWPIRLGTIYIVFKSLLSPYNCKLIMLTASNKHLLIVFCSEINHWLTLFMTFCHFTYTSLISRKTPHYYLTEPSRDSLIQCVITNVCLWATYSLEIVLVGFSSQTNRNSH